MAGNNNNSGLLYYLLSGVGLLLALTASLLRNSSYSLRDILLGYMIVGVIIYIIYLAFKK